METRKIAFACFVGGALGALIALAVAPKLWWLGIPAGFAAGYLAHEFREVFRFLPLAFAYMWSGTSGAAAKLPSKISDFFRKKHPFLYPFLIPAIVFCLWASCDLALQHMSLSLKIASNFILWTLCMSTVAIIAALYNVIGSLGAHFALKVYYRDSMFLGEPAENSIRDLKFMGYHEVELSYIGPVWWFVLGIGVLLRFFLWMIPTKLIQFGWVLTKLIHSHKRVLCGLDGAIGGALSYWLFVMNHWLFAAELTFGQRVLVVIFGGLLGATLGVANWELVSKRLLKVVSVKN